MPRGHRLSGLREVQTIIDAYFKDCAGNLLRDDSGELVFDKNGRPVIAGDKPPTVTGLAIALGFSSRKELLGFRGKRDICNAIDRAVALCEEFLETCLFNKETMKGAEFILRCNFNWSEKDKPDSSAVLSDDPLSVSLLELARRLDHDDKGGCP